MGLGVKAPSENSEDEHEEGDFNVADESGGEVDDDSGDPEVSENMESGSEDEEEQRPLSTVAIKGKKKAAPLNHRGLPFTFPAPANHEEFLEIIEDLQDEDLPVVIQRIRTLYHTSFSPENKLKLQVNTTNSCLGYLLIPFADSGEGAIRSYPLCYCTTDASSRPCFVITPSPPCHY